MAVRSRSLAVGVAKSCTGCLIDSPQFSKPSTKALSCPRNVL
jgi:hypothetical protein